MDPDAALQNMRTAIKDFDSAKDKWEDSETRDEFRILHAIALIDAVEALDDWLSKGGFLPKDWTKGR